VNGNLKLAKLRGKKLKEKFESSSHLKIAKLRVRGYCYNWSVRPPSLEIAKLRGK